MTMYAIYYNPVEYPAAARYVVRKWHGIEGQCVPQIEPTYVGLLISEARASIPGGLVRLGRYQVDDPSIVEVWL